MILPLRFDLKQASHNTDAKNTKDWDFRNAPSFVANNIAGERNGSGSRAEIPSSGCMADLTVQNLGWSPPQTPGRPKAGLEISCRSPTSEPVSSTTQRDCVPLQGSSFLVHLQKSRLFAVAFAALNPSARRLGSQLRARFRRMESDTGAPGVLATAAVLSAAGGHSTARLMQD